MTSILKVVDRTVHYVVLTEKGGGRPEDGSIYIYKSIQHRFLGVEVGDLNPVAGNVVSESNFIQPAIPLIAYGGLVDKSKWL